jgi:uncharacterized membrane protein YdbT with pleckstrin-like domain
MEGVKKYRTARISFIYNYILVLLLITFLFFLPSFNLGKLIFLAAAYGAFLLIVLLLLEPEFMKTYRYYLLEEDQLSVIEGIFIRKKLSIPYEKITDTSVSRTIMGRVLNFGDVNVSGIRNDIVLKGMRNPIKVYREIQERIPSSARKTKEGKR